MRFTGHLDLHRTWERTIRRANLPLAYTQGYRPHPRINLGSALPLGFTSQDELVDIWLECEIPIDQVEEALKSAAPPGIVIDGAELIDDHAPSLQSIITAAQYEVTLLESISGLDDKIRQTWLATSLPRQRRGKDYDLRPLIYELTHLPDDPDGNQRFQILLSSRENATGRPEEVILALGGDFTAARVHRSRLIFLTQIAAA